MTGSRPGNLAGAEKRGDAKPEHQERTEAGHDEADEVVAGGFADAACEIQVQTYGFESEDHGETDENKPDDLIPQSSGRLQNGRHHMLDELAGMARCHLLPHTFIVTKGSNGGFPGNGTTQNCRLLQWDTLVNPRLVHYNRNGWMRNP